MLNPATNGLRTSTNVGLAGGLAVVVIGILGWFWPEQASMLPTGAEAALTGIFVVIIARISNTPTRPGRF